MALSNFISKLNWRLMVVHLVAYWFIFEAFEYFAIFYDYHFVMNFYHHHNISKHMSDSNFRSIKPDDWKRILNDIRIINFVPVVSLLLTFGLSLTISIRKRWYWVNVVVVFFGALSLLILWNLSRIKTTPWTFLQYVFRAPGYFFRDTIWYFIMNGLVLFAIGLVLFFWKRITRFIDGGKDQADEQEGISPLIQQ